MIDKDMFVLSGQVICLNVNMNRNIMDISEYQFICDMLQANIFYRDLFKRLMDVQSL